MKYLSLVFASLAILFSGCASNSNHIDEYPLYTDQVIKGYENTSSVKNSDKDKMPDYSKTGNLLAASNQFRLSHASDSKLNGTYRADFNGILRLPYDITVNVNNKSFTQLRDEVMDSYKKFFQKGVESVTLTLLSRDIWVEVRGLVQKPGRYLVKPSDSIDLVVNAAGGVQGDISATYYTANIKQANFDFKVLLNNYYESNSKKMKINWLGGDNIFISRAEGGSGASELPFVSLIGGIQKPGRVLYQNNESLYYYIEKSGGLIQGLGYDECYVFRNTPEGVKKINFSFNNPETIPTIFPNDTIYMNSQVQKRADIWLQRLGYIATLVSTAALLILAL